MTSLFPSQRAAEDFDSVIEGLAPPAVVDRYADLFATVETLRTHPEVLPRAEFASDLRSRLMTAAEAELVAAPPVVRRLEPHRTHKRNRRIGTLAASLVIVGGTAGMAAAAQGSLPGDALYPVKRGIEQASVAVHPSDAGKGAALLGQASTRLDEVRELQAQDSPDAALIASTLESFRSAADAGSEKLFTAYQAGGDSSDISTVRGFTTAQMARVADMSAASNPGAGDELVDTADLLADIDQQARVLCAACAPQAPLQPPAALSSGAGAAAVDNLLARPVSQVSADVAQARAAKMARIQAAVARRAQTVAQIQSAKKAAAASEASAEAAAPVPHTVTPDGTLVPNVTSSTKTSVKNLVTGVTGTVTTVTQGVTKGKTPLDPVVKGLTDTVDGVTKQLLPTDH